MDCGPLSRIWHMSGTAGSSQCSHRAGFGWLSGRTDRPVISPQAKIREAEKRIAALTPTEELPNSDEARVKAIAKQEAAIARVSR